MQKSTFILLFGFLAIVSALDANLIKTFFYIEQNNLLSYQMFQTRNGILAYSLGDFTNPSPQYLLIDIQSGNTTEILSDIVTLCGQGFSANGRLHYHAKTHTLMYYCGSNNSLLILDEDDYSVRKTISTGINDTFEEVKLISEDYSVVVLGMGPILSENPTVTQLLNISLQADQVTSHVVFNHDLVSGEAVTGYASNGKAFYVITNKVQDYYNNMTVYSMVLVGSSYHLTELTSFSAYGQFARIITEIYCVGEYIVVNSFSNLLFLTTEGQVAKQVPYLSYKFLNYSPINPSLATLAFISGYGSSDVYAVVSGSVMKYSVNGLVIDSGTSLNAAGDMLVAIKNQTSSDIIFAIDISGYNFSILDAQQHSVISSSFIGYDRMIIAPFTYGVIQIHIERDRPVTYLYRLDLQTNNLIESYRISNQYYYDQHNYILGYLQQTQSDCELVLLDLVYGQTLTSFKFNDISICSGTIEIEDADFTFPNSPRFVISLYGGTYLTESGALDQVTFLIPPNQQQLENILVMDYDTSSFYALVAFEDNTTEVSYYQYDTTTKSFNLESSYNLSNIPVNSFYLLNKTKVVALGSNEFTVIDLVSHSAESFDFDEQWVYLSSFKDTKNVDYLILAGYQGSKPGVNKPGIFYSDKLEELPNSSNFTIQAGAAGLCSYWITDRSASYFRKVSFYDICSKFDMTKVYI